MRPVSPVIPGSKYPEVVYAKDQYPYMPLPAFVSANGGTLTRWKLSWRERLVVLLTGDIYLGILTFGRPLQPVLLMTEIDVPGSPDSL